MPILTSLQLVQSSENLVNHRNSLSRAIHKLTLAGTAIALPSVVTAISKYNLYIPPRLRLTEKDIEDIDRESLSISEKNKRASRRRSLTLSLDS
jgi:hypothetical protein